MVKVKKITLEILVTILTTFRYLVKSFPVHRNEIMACKRRGIQNPASSIILLRLKSQGGKINRCPPKHVTKHELGHIGIFHNADLDSRACFRNAESIGLADAEYRSVLARSPLVEVSAPHFRTLRVFQIGTREIIKWRFMPKEITGECIQMGERE